MAGIRIRTRLRLFDINPVNEYHTLVIPKRHFTNLFDVPVAELAHVMAAVKHVTDLLHAKAGIENIRSSIAPAWQHNKTCFICIFTSFPDTEAMDKTSDGRCVPTYRHVLTTCCNIYNKTIVENSE